MSTLPSRALVLVTIKGSVRNEIGCIVAIGILYAPDVASAAKRLR
jgi:hypothetical protein